MQKRLVRKLDLEIFLSQVKEHPSPSPSLEQYTVPADVAATMLYIAAYTNGDITSKTILDLGCGTGRLALGAAFLGAKHVVGIDVDNAAIKTAYENAKRTHLTGKVQWVNGDIGTVHGNFDTVLQNPPFGVQKRGADRSFLQKALEVGNVVYSLHKDALKDKALTQKLMLNKTSLVPVAPQPFLERFIEEHGGAVKDVYAMLMTIPRMFSFHTKRKHAFIVDLYVIERKS
jgi:putative methylase